jgi:Putative phage serine protease XkdF
MAIATLSAQRMSKHRNINLFHADDTLGHGNVVESYIYRGPDWKVPSPVDGKDYVIKSGDWLLGSTWDDYGWSLVKAGLVNGWSPEGGAQRDMKPSADKLASLRKE